jgi:hypothetical protein
MLKHRDVRSWSGALLWNVPTRFAMSVRPRVTTQQLRNEFSWNLVLRSFINVCRHIPVLVKIGRPYRALHMRTYMQLESNSLNVRWRGKYFRKENQRKWSAHLLGNKNLPKSHDYVDKEKGPESARPVTLCIHFHTCSLYSVHVTSQRNDYFCHCYVSLVKWVQVTPPGVSACLVFPWPGCEAYTTREEPHSWRRM